MQELLFVYRGKDLLAPLESLIVKLLALEQKHREEVLAFDKGSLQKHIVIMDPTTQHYLQLEAKHKGILHDLRKAQNWLREAKRTKWRKWTLDLGDLEWLYKDNL